MNLCQHQKVNAPGISTHPISSPENTVFRTRPRDTVGRANATAVLMCEASFPGGSDSMYIWSVGGHEINATLRKHYVLVREPDPME